VERNEVVVIGAGPAGLAAAGALRHYGVPAVVLERAEHVASSWRAHYDRLHLHTARRWSSLPGLRLPRRYGQFVARDDLVAYLEEYVERLNLDVRPGVEATGLDREGSQWVVHTDGGDFEADRVVIATGYNKHPYLPDWPGLDTYTGDLIHSAHYRNPEPYRGKHVLVIGTGNSGAEICVDLIEGGASRVRLSVRTPPTVLLRDQNGIPGQALGIALRRVPPPVMDRLWPLMQKNVVGDLKPYGLPDPAPGAFSKFLRDDVVPILDVGLVQMLRDRKVEIVAAVDGFDRANVLLADGTRIRPQAVIAGTGFRRGLEPLVGRFGILEPTKGRPVVHGAKTHPNAPGVHFIGYTNPISGMLREIGIDARRIAKAIARSRSLTPA
jgi:putative flavoprotein involved in K+ transport